MKAIEILKSGIVFMTAHKYLNPQSKEFLESEIAQYQDAIEELESYKKQSEEMYYKFSCVIDHATGSHASKPSIDKDVIYSLIDKNVNSWMQTAVDEVMEYELKPLEEQIAELQKPKTCEGCKWRNCLASEMEPCNSCFRRMAFIGRLFDYYEPKDKQ